MYLQVNEYWKLGAIGIIDDNEPHWNADLAGLCAMIPNMLGYIIYMLFCNRGPLSTELEV